MASAAPGDEGARRGALDLRAVGLVRRILGAHRREALLKGLEIGLGAARVDLVRSHRFLHQHADAAAAPSAESLPNRGPVLGAARGVHALARRPGRPAPRATAAASTSAAGAG